MNWYHVAAVILAALALLAYKWRYSVIGWDPQNRRNLQWALITGLLAAAAVAALLGVDRG